MNGAVELFKATRKHGVKPLVGLEAYYVDDRTVREGAVERNHLTLLAETDAGLRNLVKLSSAGFLEGLHRGKPGVDLELLARHADGVICLTGCLASRTSRRIAEGRLGEARAHLDELVQVFGAEDVYLEVQRNGLAEQEQVNAAMGRFGAELGRPLVATADVHYLRKEDFHHHAALLCVQTKSTLAQPKMSFDANEFFLKSSEEMAQAFSDVPEALASTLEIAERCNTEIELGKQLIPRYETPGGEPERDYLRALVDEGLRARYGDPVPAAAAERARSELEVIDRMGFSAYFLIVWDFVAYAKANGIAVGPGRGSAAGSIVAYALQITDVDPLRYGLLFERRQAQERGRARLGEARYRQDRRQHPRDRSLLRPAGAAHDDPAAAGCRQSSDPVRCDLHGLRRRPLWPGRRGASRHCQGAYLLRAGSAQRAQARRLPHPRLSAWSSARNTVGPRHVGPSSSPSADAQAISVSAKGRFGAPFILRLIRRVIARNLR